MKVFKSIIAICTLCMCLTAVPASAQYGKPHLVSFGITVSEVDAWNNVATVNPGFKLRIGRHNDLVNFNIGANYTWMAAHNIGAKTSEKTTVETMQHMVTPNASLHFNLPVGQKTSLYAGGGFECGLQFKEAENYEGTGILNKTTLAWKAKIGITGRHYDFGLYYKHYLKNNQIYTPEAIEVVEMGGGEAPSSQLVGMGWTLYF